MDKQTYSSNGHQYLKMKKKMNKTTCRNLTDVIFSGKKPDTNEDRVYDSIFKNF